MRIWRILFGLALVGYVYMGVHPLPELPLLPARSDLVAHALINVALAVLAVFAFTPSRALGVALVGVAALGVAIEWLQGFVPGRTPSFEDALANAAGVLAVAVVFGAWRRSAGPRPHN